MTSQVQAFDAREGGFSRISLTYAEPTGVHDGLPPGLSPADNEIGWQEALTKLAALVETG